MKKKSTTAEAIMARAEKLFDRGNYSLALKEFEKIPERLRCKDIARKIVVCRQQAEFLKAKELIKRGRKAEKKGDLNTALKCYQTAAPISQEDWIDARIKTLRQSKGCKNAVAEALAADTAGDFAKAAALYAKACDIEPTDALFAKRASCLVKAGKHAEAVSVLRSIETLNDAGRYDLGLALAKTGQYRQCLKTWEKLTDSTGRLAAQRQIVMQTFALALYDRFVEKNDLAAVYKDADFLLHTKDCDWTPDQLKFLETLREHCRYVWIENLWAQGAFETIAELLASAPYPMAPELLLLQAKTRFKLAAEDAGQLCGMLPFWLTAVYNETFAPKGTRPENVRAKLIHAARELIKRYADTPEGKQAEVIVKMESTSIETLFGLIENPQDGPHILGTPLYTAQSGDFDRILKRIRQCKSSFKDRNSYLETGVAYSPVGKSLYLLAEKRFAEALDIFSDLPQNDLADEFVTYAANLVCFSFGLNCLENGNAKVGQYFQGTPELFELAPELEREFAQKALEAEDRDILASYEQVLSQIHARRPGDGVRQALSLVMVRNALLAFNEDRLPLKALKAVAEKALQINPENDTARTVLRSTLIDIEINEMIESFNRFKLGRASRIARDSAYPKVRDHYFEAVQEIVEDLMESEMPYDEKQLVLYDVCQWAATVESDRPEINRMVCMLDTAKTEMIP